MRSKTAELTALLLLGWLSLLVSQAHAADQPVNARKLLIKRAASGRERLVFVSRDPAFLFPAIGSANDPANGSPGGVVIDLFSAAEGTAQLVVPPGESTPPGWKVRDAITDRYRYVNTDAPEGPTQVRVMVVAEAKVLKVVARATGLPLVGPQGSVGIRITMGSQRSCALFDTPTARRDEAGRFIARNALASALTDCSDAGLSGAVTRPSDPVVLTGSAVGAFVGLGTADLVGFRHGTGGWSQIPLQVDERDLINLTDVYDGFIGGNIIVEGYTDAGTFTGPDVDPSLDANDEIVFMARDAGARAVGFSEPAGVIPGSGVELTLTDSLGGGVRYVYLFEQDGSLDPGAGQAYVTYNFDLLSGDYKSTYNIASGPNPEDSVVLTPHYRRRFADRWITDDLRLFAGGASGTDLLDRHKFLFAPGVCGRSEDTFSNGEGAFVANKSGPVRAIRSYVGANSGPLTQRVHVFYERREDVVTFLRVHAIGGAMDFYDYSTSATGMTYRNEINPFGVSIDGIPDTVTPGLFSWELVSGPHGSLAMASFVDTDIPLTNPTSFYEDDATSPTTQCTGDAVAFGSSGLRLDQSIPNTDPRSLPFSSLAARRIIYYDEPGAGAADAELRRDWASHPLDVSAAVWP